MSAAVSAAPGSLLVEGLTWRPHSRAAPTLDRVDLRVAPGERVLVAGASGSGKSTLLRALAGLLDETLGELAGTVSLDDADPQRRPGAVGLLLQDPRDGLVAEHVGRDVAFGPENLALARSVIHRRVPAALDAVTFPYGADRRTAELSGGESARVALAGALALEPQILLLDEPTAMLDAEAARRVRDAVDRTVADAALTLVVAEHQLGPWLEVCGRLVVLDQGRVVADGPLAQVLVEQRDTLLAAGVWVPGAPDPEPLAVPTSTPVGLAGLRWTGLGVAAPDGTPLAHDLDGRLGAGAALAIVGPSGAGKSTLLRTLVGLAEPAAGEPRLLTPGGWQPVADLARSSRELARHVGWAAQHSEETFTARTVLGEVRATGEAVHRDDPGALAVVRARADLLLDALGLAALRDEDPYALSGGEQRRVVLAAALAHQPGVVLLDEPTAGQDRATWAASVGVIEAVRRGGGVVVAATHDPRLVARSSDVVRLAGPVAAGAAAPDHTVRPVVERGAPAAGRCNPLTLLGVAALAGVGSFWVDSARHGLLALALVLALSPLAVRRVRPVLLRLVPVGLAALSVGWSTLLLNQAGPFSAGSVALAVREIARVLYLVVPGAVVVGLLRPSSLADALTQRLHLPDRPVVAAAAGLLRLDALLETWQAMKEVRHVRGLAPGLSPAGRVRQLNSLTLASLVGVLRSAQRLALSMDARGFAAVRRRTHALSSTFGRSDAAGLVLGLLLLAAPAGLAYLS